MKIALNKNAPEFQPICVVITIETEKELNIIKGISLADLRIPNALYHKDSVEWHMVQGFLVHLNEALRGQT